MQHAIATAAQAPAIAGRFAGSSTQLIGSADGKARAVALLLGDALALDRAPLVDRERQNARVYDKLGLAEPAAFELLEMIFAARRAVAPAEEA